jgi:hypothetical protein
MTVAEITDEEGAKISNLLGEMWNDKTQRVTRAEASEQALSHALDIMTKDRDYWRKRCEDTEHERDEDRQRSELYLRQIAAARAALTEALRTEKIEKPRLVTDEQVKLLGAKFGADNRQN